MSLAENDVITFPPFLKRFSAWMGFSEGNRSVAQAPKQLLRSGLLCAGTSNRPVSPPLPQKVNIASKRYLTRPPFIHPKRQFH